MAVEQRRLVVRRLVDTHEVASQERLVELLSAEGFEVTQATVSRDLQRLGAVKIRTGGATRYAIPVDASDDPASELSRVLATRARAMVPSGNLLVVRTASGAAQFVAAAIDAVGHPAVAGSVAGDDTIIVVAAEGRSGHDLLHTFEAIGAEA
ncbi:MAG: arginine repressor [Acidimicrobiia bacterium]